MSSLFSSDFINNMKRILLGKKKETEIEIKDLENKDPFIQEYKTEGFRNLDELGEEASDLELHETLEAEKRVLEKDLSEIKESLDDISHDKYGVSHKTGKKIPEDRLKVNPTAKTNVND